MDAAFKWVVLVAVVVLGVAALVVWARSGDEGTPRNERLTTPCLPEAGCAE